MRKINVLKSRVQLKIYELLENLKNSERGDTNFVSMLLIIGIVVVLAGLFLTLGKDVMNAIGTKVMDFIKNL